MASTSGTPDITIFHVPGSRSTMVVWMCEELALPYKAVLVDSGKPRSPEHLAAHPLGLVPAFVDGGLIVQETGAQIQYLLERYSKGKLQYPPGDWERRGPFLQWCWRAEAMLLPVISEVVHHTKLLPEDKRIPQLVPYEESTVIPRLIIINDQLSNKAYIAGEEFTAADVMIGYTLSVARNSTDLLTKSDTDFKHIMRYLERVLSRPAYRAARGLAPEQ
ncbi:hypothetical protein WJX72_008118 [[Myrmecia] bisecta]|uniref:Glutathione S-transferase n=1 Tax=[Myrmecia] bisecta TaxID=41462 RepID=A0AAW1PH67_9CHLO